MFRLIVALSVLCLVSGTKNENDERIVNGRAASIVELPYQVSLQQYGSHFCGGSIFANNWILTAAHCLEDIIRYRLLNALTIRAGSTSWKSGGVLKYAKRVIVHPDYNSTSMEFDVGLIQLEGALVYSASIKPIILPRSLPPSGYPCVVSGWGQLNETNYDLPSALQAVTLRFVSNDDCKSRGFNYGSSILKSMICAMGPNQDSCQGDSGGPLAIEGERIQIGVVSWGAGCAQPGLPGVYCDLTHSGVLQFLAQYVNPLPY